MIDIARYLRSVVIPTAYAFLPPAMTSVEATALLLAIAMQESDNLRHRRQVGGPARGFWQFERGGGVAGVLQHPASRAPILRVLVALQYRQPTPDACYQAIEHNDVLAACFARCLLWTVPGRLPARDMPEIGWRQYLEAWRPGKPHYETWHAHFARGWTLALNDTMT